MRRRFRRTTTEEVVDEGSARPSDEGDELDFDQLLARELEQVDELDGTDAADEISPERSDELSGDAHEAAAAGDTAETDADADANADLDAFDPRDGAPAEPDGVEEPDVEVDTLAGAADLAPSEPLTGDFWDHYDLAKAEAELAQVPPAAVVAVVGPLDAVIPVVERCRDRHWMGDCDVFVLTQRRIVADQPGWNVVGQPSELVAVLEDGGSDFPLLVLDVPCDLPAFVRPLVAHLRERGVGLVHYVLDDDPADEDLATWHGELGRPSVLDLAGSIEASRVLELVDRGEPVVSVAGQDLSTELLLALRVETAAENQIA